MSDVYLREMKYPEMPIGEAIKLLQRNADGFEFAKVELKNRPFKEWKKLQAKKSA